MLRSHPAEALSVTVMPTGLVTLRFPVILKVTLTFIVPDSDANTPPLPTIPGACGLSRLSTPPKIGRAHV